MTYAVISDLETRFGSAEILQLSDRDGNGSADTGVVEAALNDAEAEVNGWIGRAVTLPLDPVPDTVKRIVCTVARYNLWQRNLPEDHPVYLAYRDAVKEMDAIGSGKIILPIAGGSAEATVNGSFAVKSAPTVFTATLMAGALL